ncbi:capsid protein [robinz virus RP_340]|nr:capsid protein [robinz virus RP_340]
MAKRFSLSKKKYSVRRKIMRRRSGRRRVSTRFGRRFKRRNGSIGTIQKVRGDSFFAFPISDADQPSSRNNWLPKMMKCYMPITLATNFKEFRVLGINVWFRLRYPPPVRYYYDENSLLLGSRCEIHELFYYPTCNWDQPTLNPRLSRGAYEVGTNWRKAYVKARDIGRSAVRQNNQISGLPTGMEHLNFDEWPLITNATGDTPNFHWHTQLISPRWRPSSCLFDEGTSEQGAQSVLLGFLWRSDAHPQGSGAGPDMDTDSVEFKYEIIYQFRGRKPHSMYIADTSGPGDIKAARSGTNFDPSPPTTAPTGTITLGTGTQFPIAFN